MRLTAVFAMMFLLAVNANAKEEADSKQAGEPKAKGTIYAKLKIADDLKAEFLSGPDSRLPDEIIARISPVLMTKARETHMSAPAEDGIYRLAIDWKVVSVDGQEQMKFEYRDSQPYPIVRIVPEYPRTNIPAPVEIVYRIGLAPDGSVTDVRRDEESSGNVDFYRAGREALKQWRFTPRYKDGMAVAWEVRLPLVFQQPCESACEPQEDEVEVRFTLSAQSEIEQMEVLGEIPECIDEAEFRRRVIADISVSNVARQIRAGEATSRRGVLSYQLDSCEVAQGTAVNSE